MTKRDESQGWKKYLVPSRLALILFMGIAGFFLWTEHRAHILGALPYLILLLCPLIHIFMHRGHGNHQVGATIIKGMKNDSCHDAGAQMMADKGIGSK